MPLPQADPETLAFILTSLSELKATVANLATRPDKRRKLIQMPAKAPDPAGPTFTDVVEKYLRHLKHRVIVDDIDVRSYEDTCTYLREFPLWLETHGQTHLTQAKRTDPMEWFLANGDRWNAGSTKKRIWAYVRACFTHAANQEWIERNPYAGVKLPRWRTKPREEMLPSEYVVLMRVCPRVVRRVLFLLWNTGMRPGEAFGLTPDGARLWEGVVSAVDNKAERYQNGKRLVGNTPKVKRFLANVIRRRPPHRAMTNADRVFLNSEDLPWCRHAFNKLFRHHADRGGVRLDAKPYSARHAYATQAREARVEGLRVDAQLGHSAGLRGLGMLEHYSGRLRLNADYLREIAEEIETKRSAFRRKKSAESRKGGPRHG